MIKDYRPLEVRLEGFYKYWNFIMRTEEYDPAYYSLCYLFNRFELNEEQKFWLSFLYGFTYNLCTAWVVFNEYPDLENLDIDKLKEWESQNWKILDYEVDTKYKKGKLHLSVPYYKKTVEKYGTQQKMFKEICNSDDKKENFKRTWDFVNGLYLFGRYSSYFYTETLLISNKLPIEFDSLMLEDIEGSKSHRNGLCIVLGKDEWIYHKKYNPPFKTYTKAMIEELNEGGRKIVAEMHKRYPNDKHLFTYNTLETALCADKGCRLTGRRWPGFYLWRDYDQIKSMEVHKEWYGIDWNVFWQCRKENLDERLMPESDKYYFKGIDIKLLQKHFVNTGEYLNYDWFYNE